MNNEMRLDPADLRDRAARLAELAQHVGQTHAALRDCLVRAEGSWGDDYMGVAFAEQFEPNADQLVANVREMQESLDRTAFGIGDAAGQFESQDTADAAAVGATSGGPDSATGESALSEPVGGMGSPASGGLQSPATTDRARTPAALAEPTAAPGRASSAERPVPDGGQSPSGAGERPTPDGSRRPREPSDPARREPDRPGRENRGISAGPTAGPARRAPSVPAVPPAAHRGVSSAQGGASGQRPNTDAAGRGTPWSNPPARPSGPPPGSEASPRPGTPPRPHSSPEDKPGNRDRRSLDERSVSDPVIAWLARELAQRHGVDVIGFDLPDLQVPPVREFVGAVDRVLTDYPVLAVDVVAVAESAGVSGMVRWRSEPSGFRNASRSVTLDSRTAQEPERAAAAQEPGVPERLEVYTATLREFGRALDIVGGGVARRQAQRALIAEYLHRERGKYRTFAEVVRGYQRWRTELVGADPKGRGFDMDHALGTAFAETVQYGAQAGAQAKVLHAVLVGAVSRQL